MNLLVLTYQRRLAQLMARTGAGMCEREQNRLHQRRAYLRRKIRALTSK